MNGFKSAVAATAATLAVALGGAGTALAQSASVKLAFGGSVTWFGQVPFMVAIEKGYFAEQGIEVEYKTILTSGDRVSALTAGSVDFSNMGVIAAISHMSQGNKSFYYIGNVDDSPGNEGCYAKPGINSFKELSGKKVAANTSAEITMHGLLRANGMKIEDITFLNLPPNEMAGALAKGDVDAACMWFPIMDNVMKGTPGGKMVGMDTDTDTYKKYGSMGAPDIVLLSKKLVDERPDVAKKLVAAIYKGVDFVIANPEESAKLTMKYFKKTEEETLKGIKSFSFFGTKGRAEHLAKMESVYQELADWLHANKKIPNKVDDVKAWKTTAAFQ